MAITQQSQHNSTSVSVEDFLKFIQDDSIIEDQYNYLKEPLCVPKDPLSEVPLIPDFGGDILSVTKLIENDNSYDLEDFLRCTKKLSTFPSNKAHIKTSVHNNAYVNSPPVISVIPNHKSSAENINPTSFWKPVYKSHRTPRPNINKRKLHKQCRSIGDLRCTHCQTTKTPQWREGPLGPKTLCNACGVRFKSGRLLPEYRPANSPTFDLNKHSNIHKKIVKMRSSYGDNKVCNAGSSYSVPSNMKEAAPSYMKEPKPSYMKEASNEGGAWKGRCKGSSRSVPSYMKEACNKGGAWKGRCFIMEDYYGSAYNRWLCV